MAFYRESSPIPGYTGHIPGSKFHIGGSLNRKGASFIKNELKSGKSNLEYIKIPEEQRSVSSYSIKSTQSGNELDVEVEKGSIHSSFYSINSRKKNVSSHSIESIQSESRSNKVVGQKIIPSSLNSRDSHRKSVSSYEIKSDINGKKTTEQSIIHSSLSGRNSKQSSKSLVDFEIQERELKNDNMIHNIDEKMSNILYDSKVVKPSRTGSNSIVSTSSSLVKNKLPKKLNNIDVSNSVNSNISEYAYETSNAVGTDYKKKLIKKMEKMRPTGIWDKKPIPYVQKSTSSRTNNSGEKLNPFKDAEKGWWSEGQALVNLKNKKNNDYDIDYASYDDVPSNTKQYNDNFKYYNEEE
uniref:Uncharacterized protein n=1 Tax=Parastrongyloides trichosuri TaxID=131310 RepID=A0A0N4ZRS5_PARTI